jgi:alpha-D-xyloside xylohydrolase
LVNAGFSGLLWTPEVRDAESPEDLVRRIQTVILSPLSLINGWDIPRPPWKQVKRNLNELGVDMPEKEKVTRLVREALHLRIKLLPYLYTAFFNYYRSGTPPFRALAMDYPKDRKTWQCEGQFMIGSDILAAPILAAEKKKTVYLPEGTWCEFLSGKRHSGSSYHTLSKPALGHIPLYVREGTILPLAEVVDAVRPGCNLIVRPHIYGSNDAKGELYEDDGLSYEYQEGHSIHYRLSWHKASGFHISSEGSNGKARMYHFEEACNV